MTFTKEGLDLVRALLRVERPSQAFSGLWDGLVTLLRKADKPMNEKQLRFSERYTDKSALGALNKPQATLTCVEAEVLLAARTGNNSVQ